MNREERRRLERNGNKANAQIETFGRSIADHTVKLTHQLPLLASSVQEGSLTFNPALLGILEELDKVINESLEILRKEGDGIPTV